MSKVTSMTGVGHWLVPYICHGSVPYICHRFNAGLLCRISVIALCRISVTGLMLALCAVYLSSLCAVYLSFGFCAFESPYLHLLIIYQGELRDAITSKRKSFFTKNPPNPRTLYQKSRSLSFSVA